MNVLSKFYGISFAVVVALAGGVEQVDAGPSVLAQPATPDSVVLRQVTGTIMVDRGNGYQAVRSGVELSQGDRVLVMERSGVVVATGERCAHRIGANSIVEIVAPTSSKCGAHLQRMIGTMVAQAIGLDFDDPRSAGPAGSNDGGFGAIGAEKEQQLTPLELRSAGEQPAPPLERFDAESEDPPAEIVAQEPEEKLLPIDETGLVADSEEAALQAQPLAFGEEESGSAGELFGVGATTLGAIAGGIGAVALLAGGGGGGGGGSPGGPPTPTPLSPQ